MTEEQYGHVRRPMTRERLWSARRNVVRLMRGPELVKYRLHPLDLADLRHLSQAEASSFLTLHDDGWSAFGVRIEEDNDHNLAPVLVARPLLDMRLGMAGAEHLETV